MTGPLHDLMAEVGILAEYTDQTDKVRVTPPETTRALLAAMGLDASTDDAASGTLDRLRAAKSARALPDWHVVEAGHPETVALSRSVSEARLETEDGETSDLEPGETLALPPLPVGVHRLTLDAEETTLLSAPKSLPLPPRGWGVTLPLYGLRPPEEGGLGTYADLAAVMSGLAKTGAAFAGVNPIHAGFPSDPGSFSPYAPSHRRRFNVAHIRPASEPDAVPSDLVDYRSDIPARLSALRAEFDEGGSDAARKALADRGDALRRFAVHQALSEKLGAFWSDWPEEYQDCTSDAVSRFAEMHESDVLFHVWLQLRAEEQLSEVGRTAGGMRYGLYLDLAVGTHPHGAETWGDREHFAQGVSLGAPPDAFSSDGQTWGLAPFDPLALARDGFRPLAETLRTQLRFARLLRIDHILGFERAFWVPQGDAAGAPGAYVKMPREAMLAVVRIEAARVGAAVIGEDLGNVPDGLQDALVASGVLGCRVVMFEQTGSDEAPAFRAPGDYTEAALASFSTHDLPTWAGWREGREIDARLERDLIEQETAERIHAERTREVAAFDRVAGPPDGGADGMHAFLGDTAARLVAVQIEDILGIENQPNLPGTVDAYPNWRRRLPVGPGALAGDPRVAGASRIMARAGREENE
ncbi:4-alpha-glucanotransferase [Roseicyclus sp. F158]|uniref:4-alpha-glucanotransferase n=1 Tax=Tropicimonas omnivorans TaxID=3075590 RepID=A0ABU3DEF0_9RHOB|nr:4-alpha-glucanotransferase [Roseicyclus sp. F158]MDT0681928.1 4-alpha-glucanotransferase [Roseicyclus sp. F158]